MKVMEFPVWAAVLLLGIAVCADALDRPHIVFIMADDMGWNDVSYHGSDQILTPNIDALAYQGVILQQYYSEPICTPARSALLTGKYPMRIGMQGFPLYNSEDRGIPLEERLLPSYLKELGYSTHLVGKWHVGMSRPEYLPLRRGFDTHYGLRGGFVDYYTYNKVEEWPNGRVLCGLDMFDDMKQLDKEEGYLTDLLTDRAIDLILGHNTSQPLFLQLAHGAPHAGNAGAALQPPPETSRRNAHIAFSDRRLYGDMVQSLDRSIGRVVSALAYSGMIDNTLIVFVSDNGAPSVGQYSNYGINLPYRGIKHTPWEGAVRVPALMYHSSFTPRVWNGLMHITDWLPTLISAAGGELGTTVDGIDQWDPIATNRNSKRGEVLITIDDLNNFAAYRLGDYKVVVGNVTGKKNDYYGEQWMSVKASPPAYLPALRSSEVVRVLESVGRPLDLDSVASMREASTVRQLDSESDRVLCVPSPARGCLFNVRRDPQERHDLWDTATSVAARLIARLRAFWSVRQPRGPLLLDDRAEPSVRHYTWLPWLPDGSGETDSIYIYPSITPFPQMNGSTFLKGTTFGQEYDSGNIRFREQNDINSRPHGLQQGKSGLVRPNEFRQPVQTKSGAKAGSGETDSIYIYPSITPFPQMNGSTFLKETTLGQEYDSGNSRFREQNDINSKPHGVQQSKSALVRPNEFRQPVQTKSGVVQNISILTQLGIESVTPGSSSTAACGNLSRQTFLCFMKALAQS